MTYRIMIKTASGSKDQYQFLTIVNENGENEIWESTSLADVDTKVEKMINGNYRKKDILVVSVWDFNAFADLYDNSKKPQPTPDPDPEPEPEPEPTPDPENTEPENTEPTSDPSSDPLNESSTDPEPTTDPTTEPTTDPANP